MFFDARAAKLLQPGQALAVQGCPGLRLLATQTRKTWTYRYRAPDGRLRQVAIGQWPQVAAGDALARWAQLRSDKSDGLDPAAQRKAQRQAKATPTPAESYTVAQLVGDYIKEHLAVSRAPAGAQAAKRALEKVLDEESAFAALDAAAVTRADAFALLDARKDTPTAAAKLRSMLGAAWDYALDAGRLDGTAPNWWRQVMRGRLKSKGKVVAGQHLGQRRRVLSGAEVGELLRWLPNMHAAARDGVVLYLWTGARGSEIFGMQAGHVRKEADGWWWTIPKSATKNARHAEAVDLRVPLIGRALDVVARRIEGANESGYLFASEGGARYTQHAFSTYIYDLQPYSPKSVRAAANASADAPGRPALPVVDWTPHNLRRTARTLLAALGCPSDVGEAIVGHMPDVIEATYNVHTYDAERRLWLRRLAGHLEALAAPSPASGAPARP